MFRRLRRLIVPALRAAESAALYLGRRPWKVDKFCRMIQPEVLSAVRKIGSADVVVGIPFHKESGNVAELVAKTRRDLEARGSRAAIVIVGERNSKPLLLSAPLPASSDLVKIVAFFKPFGFAQRPGLTRRSWSHWAMLDIANRLGADVVFIDADVRNSEGWVNLYLDAIRKRGAGVAVAEYIRRFDRDDAIVHIWDRLIFGAVFRKWIAFRHGGDYAISHTLLPGILADRSIMRERAYTMDSAIMAHVARRDGAIEPVWLGSKEHEPISVENLFNRLPTVVHSVFDDVGAHLPALLSASGKTAPARLPMAPSAGHMRDLIGPTFRRDLHRDMAARFEAAAADIRSTLGASRFERFAAAVNCADPEDAFISPRDWARATIAFLVRYVRSKNPGRRNRLARAYVPAMEAGILGFLNSTWPLSYDEAFARLDTEYLAAFRSTWDSLSRRLVLYRLTRPGRLTGLTPVSFLTRLAEGVRDNLMPDSRADARRAKIDPWPFRTHKPLSRPPSRPS